jgi:hypothetical protein
MTVVLYQPIWTTVYYPIRTTMRLYRQTRMVPVDSRDHRDEHVHLARTYQPVDELAVG